MSNQEKEKAIRIMEALSNVDESLLARCEQESKKENKTAKIVPLRRYGKVLAACLVCVVLCSGFLAVTGGVRWNGAKNEQSAKYMFAEDNALAAAESAQESVMEAGMDSAATTEMDSAGSQDVNGIPVQEAGRVEDYTATKEHIYEGAGGANKNDAMESAQQDSAPEPETVGTSADVSGSLVDNRVELTMKEALLVEGLGEYIPQTLPNEYVLESIRAKKGISEEQGMELLTLCWSRGMDTVMVSVQDVSACGLEQFVEERLVDMEETKTYDVHLYEIPYAETVPAEYRQIFQNPIFEEGDMTKEVVESRMKVVADAGDTGTPRGNFGVLYESGVLVEFHVDATVDEVWEMYLSITK